MRLEKRRRWLVVPLTLCLLVSAPAQDGPAETASRVRELARALVSAKSQEERAALLASKKQLVTPDLRKQLIAEGNTFLAEGKYAEASGVYELAGRVAEQINDAEGVAAVSLNVGTVHYLQGNYERALASYQKARQLFEQRNDRAEVGRAFAGSG
ncbi:MAG TPA: tetratricopeptide repeat protein, partial [Pyrinomonadaceae bacterium]|nr:tetratricopeptide repeat protein [Pyrinomonadaceae bacterium]